MLNSSLKSESTKRLLFLTILGVLFSLQNVNAQLEGDREAVNLVNSMLSAIGGENVWRNAQSIKVELVGYYALEENPWEETFWLDLRRARGRFIIKSKSKDELIAWTPISGWKMADGILEAQDSARHSLEMEYWKRQAVVVFHRLAMGKPETVVKMGDNKFEFDVIDANNNEFIARLTVNKKGEPVKWGTKIGDLELEHVFGPLKTFKNVNLPSWGSTTSGMWRYEHSSITLSKSPPQVSFDPPTKE